MNKQIDAYLQKATRGLWGKKRLEVKEELSTHIEGRIYVHLIAGLSENDAVEKTLGELGKPMEVSNGMTRLYTLPIMAGSGFIFTICCALIVIVLNASTAQTLNPINVFPAKDCSDTESELPWYCTTGGWISIENLKAVLEPQGISFSARENAWVVTFSDESKVFLLATPQEWSFYMNDIEPVTLSSEPGYMQLREIIRAFSRSKSLPVSLEGWEKPILTIGNATVEITFPVSNTQPSYDSLAFYSEPISWELFNEIPTKYYSTSITSQDITTETKTLDINDEEGAVYGLVTIIDSSTAPNVERDVIDNITVMYWDVTQVDSGKIKFSVPTNHEMTFLPNTYINKPGRSILVRLSGDLSDALGGYVVIPPEQFTLE